MQKYSWILLKIALTNFSNLSVEMGVFIIYLKSRLRKPFSEFWTTRSCIGSQKPKFSHENPEIVQLIFRLGFRARLDPLKVIIWTLSWNTYLYPIQLYFQLNLNKLNQITESKFMVKIMSSAQARIQIRIWLG